jgi:hypothetical protein
MRFISTFLLFFLFHILFFPGTCFTDSPVTDPSIPDGEKITYTVTEGSETYSLVQYAVQVKENGKELYEVTTETKKEDTVIRIDRKTMIVVYSRTTRRNTEFIVERQTIVIKNHIAAQPGEMVVIDFSGIQQILRGFPFGKIDVFTIKIAGSDSFTMKVKMKRETTVKTAIGKIRCYELELSIEGFWGNFLPKTHLWYSMNAPHYLVQYKGQEGAPGSPKITILLTDYKNE